MKKFLSIAAVLALVALLAGAAGKASSAHAQSVGSPIGGPDGLSVTQGAAQAGGDIVILLHQLTVIKLDHALFDSPAFQSLKDFSVPVTAEQVSRPNPFAPIGQ